MKVCIVGGGFMGMVLAKRMVELGMRVKVIEREDQPGGLATYHDFGNFTWDRFYHVIVPSDSGLIRFIRDIGLEDELNWRPALTGYYVNKEFHSISNMKEFLFFKPLGLFNKLLLGFTIFYGSRINNWRKLEKITVKDWLIRIGGKKTFEKFWKPLLLAKLGSYYERVSAVFIWTYIKRLFKAREYPAQKEELGYVSGGYKRVFDQLQNQLEAQGSEVVLDTAVSRIEADVMGGVTLHHSGGQEHFDKIVFTAPLNILEKVTSPELCEIVKKDSPIEYLGVVCLVLVTKEPLTPFYTVNLADERIPFTGVIGMSSVVDTEETAGEYLTYFPKYVAADHAYWSQSEDEIKELFMKGVFKLYPELDASSILGIHVNKAFKVQPMQVVNYSQIIPEILTKHPDFYVLNTSQFVSDSVNNNTVVNHVDAFIKQYAHQFKTKKPVLTDK